MITILLISVSVVIYYIMRYHIYWQDKILLKDLDEEEFKNIWEKMHWVYNNELNYVEVGEHILEEASY